MTNCQLNKIICGYIIIRQCPLNALISYKNGNQIQYNCFNYLKYKLQNHHYYNVIHSEVILTVE